MKQRIFFLALIVFVIVLGFHEKAQSRPPLPAQDLAARCVARFQQSGVNTRGPARHGRAHRRTTPNAPCGGRQSKRLPW